MLHRARPGPVRLSCVAAAAIIAGAVISACGSARAGKPLAVGRSPAAVHRAVGSHFVLIMLENRELREVLGDSSAPYIARLAHQGALAVNYHAITHPSLPNYIAVLAGSPLGIESDCTECAANGSELTDQLEAAHLSWRAYMEGMPSPCFGGAESGGYAKRHDPFMYFSQITSSPGRCANVVPFTQLAGALRSGQLPSFAWITPNLCDDGHDCANASVNAFLENTVPYLLPALGPKGVLAITWDEGSTNSGCCTQAAGGTVGLILLGRSVRRAARLTAAADHYSLLALIERMFGLPPLRGAACPCTPSLAGAFKRGAQPQLARG
ncbi:MAG: alkaline phosphatase family protein [Solirubrobacteraceae bacterium]